MTIQFLEPIISYHEISSPFQSNLKYLSKLTSEEFKNSVYGYYLTFHLIELLSKYFEFEDISTICDIGARYGETSFEFSLLFPHASIYAFDPHPFNQNNFKKLKEKYPDRGQNINWTAAALDKTKSEKPFHMTADDPGTYSLLETNLSHPWAQSWGKYESLAKSGRINRFLQSYGKFDESIQILDEGGNPKVLPLVQTIRLDTFCKEKSISSVDILWIDVQGFEENVLVGCGSILDSVKAVHVETSLQPSGEGVYLNAANFKAVNQLLTSKGFKLMSVITALNDTNPVEGDLIYLSKRFIC